jgi:hypothetical protein
MPVSPEINLRPTDNALRGPRAGVTGSRGWVSAGLRRVVENMDIAAAAQAAQQARRRSSGDSWPGKAADPAARRTAGMA